MEKFVRPYNRKAAKTIFIPVKVFDGKIIEYDNDYQYIYQKDCQKLCVLRNKVSKTFGTWSVAQYGDVKIVTEGVE